jgi:hypothetical protein
MPRPSPLSAAERQRRKRARRNAGIEEIIGVPFTHEMIEALIESGQIDLEDSRDPKKLARALVKRAKLPPPPEIA